MRNTLGRFPAIPVKIKQSLSALMTRWVGGEPLPHGFEFGGECELRHPDPDGGVISCKHQDLEATEVRNHIKNGKYAVKLALQWKERLSCVLHEDLSIKRLRFEDIIKDAESETEADDPVSRFDLDFSIMVLELAEFFPQLLTALGGEDLPEKLAAKAAPAAATSEAPAETEARIEATGDFVESLAVADTGPRRTSIGAYGELHYNNISADSGDTEEIDFHRFVLFFGHDFNDRIIRGFAESAFRKPRLRKAQKYRNYDRAYLQSVVK